MKLTCGRDVYLDSFYYKATYAGVLEGLPSQEVNDRRMAKTLTLMEPLWGKRKTHIISPVTYQKHGATFLPDITYIVWLMSYQAVNPKFDGSELVVVWFGPKSPEVPLEKLVHDAVVDLPWDTLAKDFEW